MCRGFSRSREGQQSVSSQLSVPKNQWQSRRAEGQLTMLMLYVCVCVVLLYHTHQRSIEPPPHPIQAKAAEERGVLLSRRGHSHSYSRAGPNCERINRATSKQSNILPWANAHSRQTPSLHHGGRCHGRSKASGCERGRGCAAGGRGSAVLSDNRGGARAHKPLLTTANRQLTG